MPCLLCGGPTIKSHLFPRALVHDARGGQPHLLMGRKGQPGYRHTQSGEFDAQLVCRAHEDVLSALDKYGISFIRGFFERRKRVPAHESAWYLEEVDSDQLVRFVASVVWRWAMSSKPDARDLSLGDQEARIRAVVFGKHDCSFEPEVGISCFTTIRVPIDVVRQTIMLPSMDKFSGVRFWHFVIGGLTFVVKIDNRPKPAEVQFPAVNGRSIIVVIERVLEQTIEWENVRRVVDDMKGRRQR